MSNNPPLHLRRPAPAQHDEPLLPTERNAMTAAHIERLLKRHDVCELLQIGDSTLRKLTALGKIRPVRHGRSVRYQPAEIRRYIEENSG